jgi:hypothetical protein
MKTNDDLAFEFVSTTNRDIQRIDRLLKKL